MKQTRSILKNRRGASVILAILIFLLCALAGASAFIMATANAGRYSHSEDDQQPYYTVTSAAMLMLDLLDGARYESQPIKYIYERTWHFEEGKTEGGTEEPPSHPQTEKYTINIFDDVKYKDAIKKATDSDGTLHYDFENNSMLQYWKLNVNSDKYDASLKGAMHHTNSNLNKLGLYSQIASYVDRLIPFLGIQQEWYSTVEEHIKRDYFKPTEEEYLNYTFKITTDDDKLGEVQCRLIMKENYDMILSFVYAVENDNNKSQYAANIYWEAEVKDVTNSKQSEMVYTEDIGGKDKGTIGTMTTTNTKTITVEWKKENATLSRGEAA